MKTKILQEYAKDKLYLFPPTTNAVSLPILV
jgi:hypothetical protein